jgi:thymidylate synthase (FAD)
VKQARAACVTTYSTVHSMHTATLVHATNDGEQLIAYMARVSNPKNQDNPHSAKLIKYLITHKHWSPFEMVNMCVEINTTRSVAAQILRHRSFSFQEFSQRYSIVTDSPVIPQLREQDTTNRQNSTDTLPSKLTDELKSKIDDLYSHSQDVYSLLIANGVAKECARDVLPLSSPTKLYMNGTLRSWLHYCDLRCANGTQYEHKLIADQVKSLIAIHFPKVYTAMWYDC